MRFASIPAKNSRLGWMFSLLLDTSSAGDEIKGVSSVIRSYLLLLYVYRSPVEQLSGPR